MTKVNTKVEIDDQSKRGSRLTEDAQGKSLSSILRGIVNGVSVFFAETQGELRRVEWLDRKKLFTYFSIVLIITIAITIFVTAVDVVLAELFKLLKIII